MIDYNYYFDYYSTTPISKVILKNLLKYNHYANPSSYHNKGIDSKKELNKFKRYIESFINAEKDTLVFTSGATESNNIVIQGIIKFNYDRVKRKSHVVCSIMEHDSILEVLSYYESIELIEISWCYPNKDGVITSKEVEDNIRKETLLVICMYVSHEFGTINEIEEIGKLCKKSNIYFHVDCSQAYGKISIDVKKLNISSLSFSGHKIYCLKGIGGLYLSKSLKRIKASNLYYGGSQQRLKSGTIPLELCYLLYLTSKIEKSRMLKESLKLRKLQLEMHKNIMLNLKDTYINGAIDSRRMYNNLNYSFYGVEGESIISHLSKYCLSTGSACRSDKLELTKSMKFMAGYERGHSSVRITLGKYTKRKYCTILVNNLIEVINNLRKMSPIYNKY